MALKIYNTMTGQKELFVPLKPGEVSMYVCGVTVYDECHLGHARANVAFDVIYRYLCYLNYRVNYIRNFTDIDDKIIKRSEELGINWKDLTERMIIAFHAAMSALGNLPPTEEPKATDHILQMIALIQKLIDQGLAYPINGDVFFRVRKFKDYGKLSGKSIDDLEAGARVQVREAKEDPLDFALWKAAKPGEPSWLSPWGQGRPGWHIECSAMSLLKLGETFDLHGGGRDLIFPHHENEIAQSEGATQKPFVRYWLHNGFVNINADKMSKSLGNMLWVKDVLKTEDWEVLRLFFLSVHYRSPIDFSSQNLLETEQSLFRYYETIERVHAFLALPEKNGQTRSSQPDAETKPILEQLEAFKAAFDTAMEDDFNTARVLGELFEALRIANKLLDQFEAKKPDWLKAAFLGFLDQIDCLGSVFGCLGRDVQRFIERQKQRVLTKASLTEQDVLSRIAERSAARKQKNFQEADRIRDELFEKRILLKDRTDGTTDWSVK